jgi:nitroreductase
MAYHQLEKGLSMPAVRPGFGVQPVGKLLRVLPEFLAERGLVAPASVAVGTLDRYIAFNEQKGVDVSRVKGQLQALEQRFGFHAKDCVEGGSRPVRRADLQRAIDFDFAAFFESRHSVRQFAGGEIPRGVIERAVGVALKTPPVCNRQAFRVHAYADPEMRAKLLAVQAGSRGFGDGASVVLVVTCDLTYFVNVGERYQAWIDGGMFSMSLCLSFHALGLGSCCLNWSKERRDDLALRRISSIPDTEQVIMLLAVGTLPEEFSVAYSARNELPSVLQIH